MAAVIFAVWAIDDSGDTGARADVVDDCGADIGKDGPVAFVAYSLSNIANSENNSVLAVPYRQGDMKPMGISQCMTGGSGATQLMMPGTVDGNDQIVVNPEKTLLFAVNQGSDTIAVFNIQENGGLKPVDGSPFPSGGKAPGSLGLSGDTLLVVNRSRDGVRDLEKIPPNYTSFKIAADGKLTRVPGSNVEAAPATAPTAIQAPPQGGVAFGPSDGGPIRGFSVGQDGVLTEAPGSPYAAPPSAYPPSYDPKAEFALGTGTHPTKPYVYMPLPTAPALAVYSYDDTGKLTFENSVPTVGAFLPCWIAITKDGRWLYTTSAATNNVTVFDITDPTKPEADPEHRLHGPGQCLEPRARPDGQVPGREQPARRAGGAARQGQLPARAQRRGRRQAHGPGPRPGQSDQAAGPDRRGPVRDRGRRARRLTRAR